MPKPSKSNGCDSNFPSIDIFNQLARRQRYWDLKPLLFLSSLLHDILMSLDYVELRWIKKY
jgi:hypothetical protein